MPDPSSDADNGPFHAWNPGIGSQVPERLLHRATIFRTENTFTTVDNAREFRDFTGLDYREIVAFRPERLALHELLIRVTADVSVPDGLRVEDLGINFRRILRALLVRCIDPRMSEIVALHESCRRDITKAIERALAGIRSNATATHEAHATPRRGWLSLLARRNARAVAPVAAAEDETIAVWEQQGHSADDPLQRSICRALAKVAAAVNVRQGSVRGAYDIVASLATNVACNDFAGHAIGATMAPWLLDVTQHEGYRLLPPQDQPVVMNTKGASAAGKSTIRPLQRELARDIGVRWGDFALISPDIWRKQLLDYATLGGDYKYGAALTADELHVIDQKLDHYMANKAERGEMTHLLIDRFRFDSFAPDSREAGSNLLTRFGQVVYLFFMITPPESLVERAWNRGLELGRYKAVDDTLAHAIEAYSGMPGLFFTWVNRADKHVHFEFLDNSVPLGDRPRTIAFGTNETLCILDVGAMVDIERYRRIDVDAKSPTELYADTGLLAADHNMTFVTACIRHFANVYFADPSNCRVYLELTRGKAIHCDPGALERAVTKADTRAALAISGITGQRIPAYERAPLLQELNPDALRRTLGQWGGRQSRITTSDATPSVA